MQILTIYSRLTILNGKMQIMTDLATIQPVTIQMLVLELKDTRTKTDLAAQIPTAMDTQTQTVDGLLITGRMSGQMMQHSG